MILSGVVSVLLKATVLLVLVVCTTQLPKLTVEGLKV